MQYKQVEGRRQPLPKAWTLKDGSQTGNFDLLPEAVHNDEGWFQCGDDPIIDTPETHKLGVDTLIINKWQREAVTKTTQELDEFTAWQVELDKLAAIEVVLAASAFKGMTIDEAKAYSDENATDLVGVQKVLRKIITALMALHPHEL